MADTLSRLIEMDGDIKLHPEEEGKEFGYFPFEELPPVTTQVLEEGIKCEIGNINLQHPEPVQIDIEITLPMKDEKLTTLQQYDPCIKQPENNGQKTASIATSTRWRTTYRDENSSTMDFCTHP